MHEEIKNQETGNVCKQATLFKPASWQTKIDFINHLVLFNNVLIAVLAEKEGGKTAFVSLLDKHLDSQIKSCILSAPVPCNEQYIIENIAQALHLKNEDASPLTTASVIKQINERKAFVLLIIDNAQNIPETWLKEVLEEIQQQKEQSYFHLCLVSDYSVVANYNNLAKADPKNAIHSIELGTLNENETKTYLLHKGALVNKTYNEEQLTNLYKMTGGCMAKINHHIATKQPVLRLNRRNYIPYIKRTCIAASLALMVGVISWMTVDMKKPLAVMEQNVALNEIQAPILESTMPNWQEGERQFVYQELPKEQVLAMLDENEIKSQNKVEDNLKIIPNININKAVNISKQNASSYLAPIKKIRLSKEQENRGYTIQLLASHQISDIQKFIRQYDLKDKGAIRKFVSQNDSWYVLTIGNYATFEQANSAAHNLSSKFSRVKPWVRLTSNLKSVG